MQSASGNPEPHTDFIAHLSDLSVINVTGIDTNKYLQGQITVDVEQLDHNIALIGCHCDFKGKMWNIFYAIGQAQDVSLICHQESVDSSLRELKKYGVFSKVEIEDASQQWTLLGGTGAELANLVNAVFHQAPDRDKQVIHCDSGFVVYLESPEPRFLLMLKKGAAQAFIDEYPQPLSPVDRWNALDIQAGIANIQQATSNQFVPQMVNMQALGAIDFEKGCYMGQEVVARTKYLGKNKRAAFILKGQSQFSVKAGDMLEMQIGDNWRRGGTVLRTSKTEGEDWILAVLANDTNQGQQLRLKERPNEIFTVQPQPYSI